MFERFTDPVTVVRTVLARDINKLRKLVHGGARIDCRTKCDPWMTPLDAACTTKQIEAIEMLLDAGAPVYGSAIYDAIAADFVGGLQAFERHDEKFHQKFQQEAGNNRNPRLNRWLSEFTALDFAISVHAMKCSEFLQSINARRHEHIKPHRGTCSAVFIEEESFVSIRGVNLNGLTEVTSGFYCAKCLCFINSKY